MRLSAQYNLGPNPLLTKVLPIGVWNMVATNAVSVPHGLTYAQILEVYTLIHNDTLSTGYPLEYSELFTDWDGDLVWTNTNVSLYRRAGGHFATAAFDDAVMNRGFVTIKYVQ